MRSLLLSVRLIILPFVGKSERSWQAASSKRDRRIADHAIIQHPLRRLFASNASLLVGFVLPQKAKFWLKRQGSSDTRRLTGRKNQSDRLDTSLGLPQVLPSECTNRPSTLMRNQKGNPRISARRTVILSSGKVRFLKHILLQSNN